MAQLETFVLDLYATTAGEKAECMAACRHCPHGKKTPGIPVSPDGFSYALYEAVKRISAYCKGGIARIEQMNFAAHVVPSVARPFSFLDGVPSEITYPFNLAGIDLDEEEAIKGLRTSLNESYEVLAGFLRGLNTSETAILPRLTFSLHPTLRGDRVGFTEEFALIAFLKCYSSSYPSSVLNGAVDPSYLGFNISINDVLPESFDASVGTELQQFQWLAYQNTLAKLLAGGQGFKHTGWAGGYSPGHFESRINTWNLDTAGEVCVLESTVRLLRYRVPVPETKIDTRALAFFPDHVWVGHSTRNTVDQGLRMSYEDFFICIDRANKGEATLSEALCQRLGFDPATRKRLA